MQGGARSFPRHCVFPVPSGAVACAWVRAAPFSERCSCSAPSVASRKVRWPRESGVCRNVIGTHPIEALLDLRRYRHDFFRPVTSGLRAPSGLQRERDQRGNVEERGRLAVNLLGTIEARSISGQNGNFVLDAGYGGGGLVQVNNGARIDASGTGRENDGKVTITGENVFLAGTIDVSGAKGEAASIQARRRLIVDSKISAVVQGKVSASVRTKARSLRFLMRKSKCRAIASRT